MKNLIKFLWRKLGQGKHNFVLVSHSNRHRCTKCGHILYIPMYSEFRYRLKEFKGCKG